MVLVDIGLPGISGYDVTKQLRNFEGCKAAVFIAISGYGQDEDRRRSTEAGIDHHLVKPVDYSNLFDLLSNYLHKAVDGQGQ